MAAGRRTVAVLSEMAELGDTARDGHEEAGRLAAEAKAMHVVVADRRLGVPGSASLSDPLVRRKPQKKLLRSGWLLTGIASRRGLRPGAGDGQRAHCQPGPSAPKSQHISLLTTEFALYGRAR